ncbi:O-antigen polymerase [Flavobacterium sp. W4I14]|nr:O-antigen polymerase [Flavobacterium sp. W4I14]
MIKKNTSDKTTGNSTVFLSLLFSLITVTLINSKSFIYPSMFSLYGFIILGSLFGMLVVGMLLLRKNRVLLPILPVVWCFAGYMFYLCIHAMLFSGINQKHLYLIFSSCLFFLLFIFFYVYDLKLMHLFSCIILLAALESLVCIAQFYGLLKVENIYFVVTGTWANPNVIAMFLAMAFPAAAVLIWQNKILSKMLGITVIVMMIIALAMLKCRTAIISATVSTAVLINYRYKVMFWIRQKQNRFKGAVLLLCCLVIGAFSASQLYKSKQSSADGRKFIWKVSTAMLADKAIMGYGYGTFEKYYNLKQADYFKSGSGSEMERTNAGYVKTAYNEFLEHALQGGLLGSLFFFSLFVSLIAMYPNRNIPESEGNFRDRSRPARTDLDHTMAAYSAIAGFLVMSILNFTLQAVPVFCLFIIYAAIVSAAYARRQLKKEKGADITLYLPISVTGGFLFLIFSYFIVSYSIKANADLQNRFARDLAKIGDRSKALQILRGLEVHLSEYDGYWMNYGNVLYADKKYDMALQKYNIAKKISSNPEIYMQTGRCYKKLLNPEQAIVDFGIVSDMVPNRFAPQFQLMVLYHQKKDLLKAVFMAKSILSLQPKIESSETDRYKSQANNFLKKYDLQ